MPIFKIEDYVASPPQLNRMEGGRRLQSHSPQLNPARQPKVSIVTVVRNGESMLGETIQSVLEQSYTNIEYIVIDGASTDGTINVLRNYEDRIDYWMSESDKGIADAWNKGIASCQGDIVGILNAGDFFDRSSVELVVQSLDPSTIAVSYGTTILIDEHDKVLKTVEGNFDSRKLAMGIGFMHPGCFATRAVYELVGLFRTNYRLAMDCDWLFRCYRKGVTFQKLSNICYMRDGGESARSRYTAYGEYLQSMLDNGFPETQVRYAMLQYAVTVSLRQTAKRMLGRR